MGDIIVIQFITLDGVVSDPDGRGGTGHGGWAFKFGSGPVDGDKFLGGFSVRAKGPMVYVGDAEVVAKHKPQLGTLAAGNAACVLYKPTKSLDAAALKALFETMFSEVAAKQK